MESRKQMNPVHCKDCNNVLGYTWDEPPQSLLCIACGSCVADVMNLVNEKQIPVPKIADLYALYIRDQGELNIFKRNLQWLKEDLQEHKNKLSK